MVRVFARNEVGTSDPLETEDPVKIIRPDGKDLNSENSSRFCSKFKLGWSTMNVLFLRHQQIY